MDTPLEKSIIHWEENLELALRGKFNFITYSGSSCALCQAHPGCVGCPVAYKTEQKYCRNTPYQRVIDALEMSWRDIDRDEGERY